MKIVPANAGVQGCPDPTLTCDEIVIFKVMEQ
jgi:hypothetical protein